VNERKPRLPEVIEEAKRGAVARRHGKWVRQDDGGVGGGGKSKVNMRNHSQGDTLKAYQGGGGGGGGAGKGKRRKGAQTC